MKGEENPLHPSQRAARHPSPFFSEKEMIYLNGKFMPLEEAKISVMDRGFIFGDGVYELIPSYSGHPFRLKEHLRRLQVSLDGIRLKNPHSEAEWSKTIRELIKLHKDVDQAIYLQVTRGVGWKRDHALPKDAQPTVFIMSNPLVTPPAEQLNNGVLGITAQDNRWLRCDLKTTSLLANVLLRQLALDSGATETVLLRDGYLTEGSASNIFIVKNSVLLAPPKNNLILPGITYDVVLELAAENRLQREVRPISEKELRSADEIILTSSGKEILAITQLDSRKVGDGKPGPIAKQIYKLYQDYKAKVMRMPDDR